MVQTLAVYGYSLAAFIPFTVRLLPLPPSFPLPLP